MTAASAESPDVSAGKPAVSVSDRSGNFRWNASSPRFVSSGVKLFSPANTPFPDRGISYGEVRLSISATVHPLEAESSQPGGNPEEVSAQVATEKAELAKRTQFTRYDPIEYFFAIGDD